jgi:hypothetical protein
MLHYLHHVDSSLLIHHHFKQSPVSSDLSGRLIPDHQPSGTTAQPEQTEEDGGSLLR